MSRHALSPDLGVSRLVGDCEDHDPDGLDQIEDSVREAARQGAADFVMDSLIERWVITNAVENAPDLVKELLAKTGALLLVPVVPVLEVRTGFVAERKAVAHRERRMLSTASSQVLPRSGFSR